MNRFFTGVLLSFVAVTSQAHPNQANGLITTLQTFGNGGGPVYIGINADLSGLNCTLVNGSMLTLMPDQTNFRQIYASLLTAYAMQRPLVVRIGEGTTDCRVSYVSLY